MGCQNKCNITSLDMGTSTVASCSGCGRVWEMPKQLPKFPPESGEQLETNTEEKTTNEIKQALPFSVVVFGDEK